MYVEMRATKTFSCVVVVVASLNKKYDVIIIVSRFRYARDKQTTDVS